MDRSDRSGIARFVWDQAVTVSETVPLSGAPLQHALVRRVRSGDAVQLLDGRGTVASGTVASASKTRITVTIARVESVPRPMALEALVPVADRDRMLWAAEKCVELQVTSWRPVLFARSRSVSPRGEGAKFAVKLHARMCAALEQCGGAWLPDTHPEAEFVDALQRVRSDGARLVLDASGASIAAAVTNGPVALAVGPEGGFEPQELESATAMGWLAISLGPTTLRFETAIVGGAAVVRAAQLPSGSV